MNKQIIDLQNKIDELEKELKRHQTLEFDLARLASVIEESDDAIITKTLEGIITSWNKAAQRIFGYSANEVIGKSVAILIPPEMPNEEPEILEGLKKGERFDHYETVRIGKDGKLIDISLSVSPIKDLQGN